ncbi:VanZ family protein [Aeromicrobium wangtongii]|uniref:VanZ family protein n=1 Tax=Aeromicrobium wangtongii TaxID=2969247 RepID=A0ABY5MC16_9ACTN|nr:VanZ family protein [Aeromicrobium wangtongii]MCD9197228.1 VanZ family protein [Aeromicrobium wangtongii]UUP14724.1 VanZ family protein [Aeromicrobium wangtongii]
MTTTQEVPTLLVVVPVAAVTLGLMTWLLHRRAGVTVPRLAVAVVAAVYVAGIVANTLLPFRLGATGPSPSWTVFLDLVPLADVEQGDVLQNVVVFLPLGWLLALVLGVDSAVRVVLGGLLLSLAMEAVQLGNAVTGHGGHVADVDDLWANTVGGALGYGLFRLVVLVPPLGRLAAAATWPAPGRERRLTARRARRASADARRW